MILIKGLRADVNVDSDGERERQQRQHDSRHRFPPQSARISRGRDYPNESSLAVRDVWTVACGAWRARNERRRRVFETRGSDDRSSPPVVSAN